MFKHLIEHVAFNWWRTWDIYIVDCSIYLPGTSKQFIWSKFKILSCSSQGSQVLGVVLLFLTLMHYILVETKKPWVNIKKFNMSETTFKNNKNCYKKDIKINIIGQIIFLIFICSFRCSFDVWSSCVVRIIFIKDISSIQEYPPTF